MDGIEAAAVYGSVAAGSDTGRSDIDVLIVGSPDEIALHESVSTLEEELGRPINYTLLSRSELKARLRKKDAFVNRVLAGKMIPIVGAIDED